MGDDEKRIREFAGLVDEVKIGPGWSELKDRFAEPLRADVLAAGPALMALDRGRDRASAQARRNMAVSLLTELSVLPDGVAGLLAVARRPDLPRYLVDALVDLVGMMPVAAVDDMISGLDPETPHEVEVGFAMAQERLIRHHDISSAGHALHDAARQRGLAGGWLPATLHDLEVDHRCRVTFGGRHQTPQAKPTLEPLIAPGGESLGEVLAARSLTTSVYPAPQRCAIAHEAMVLESNGQIETVLFDTERPRTVGEAPGGSGVDDDASATRIPAWAAAQSFFVSSPGAYTKRRTVWQARLLMGQAIAGFVDAPPNAPFLDVMDRSQSVDWYRVEAAEGWFHQIAWDVGLLGCTESRGVLLLATDTD